MAQTSTNVVSSSFLSFVYKNFGLLRISKFHPVISLLLLLISFPIISFSLCPFPDDSWLEITAQDLDHMLQQRSGGGAEVGSHDCSSTKHTRHLEGTEEREGETELTKEEECGYSLVAVSQGMKKFLDAMSSHEGAEVPW